MRLEEDAREDLYDWYNFQSCVINWIIPEYNHRPFYLVRGDLLPSNILVDSNNTMSGLFAYMQSTGTALRMADANTSATPGAAAATNTRPPWSKIEVSKTSLLGQMMDPMNRNKSQQVLMIKHMVKSMADLVEMYKNREVRIKALKDEVMRLIK